MNAPIRRDPEETRAAILSSAWDLFRELGARATIADIAERLGMSSANIYRFYASKQGLCEAVCANVLSALAARVREMAAGPGAASDRIRAIMLFLNAAMREQMTQEARVHEIVEVAIREHWPPIEAYETATCEIVAGLVADGQAAGEFGPGDPAALGLLAICACSGIHHPWLIALYADKPNSPPPERIVDFAIRALANPEPSTD